MKKIYLDLCFWIKIRDRKIASQESNLSIKLYELLLEGVNEGSIICPISETIFLELMKQGDVESRRDTAALMQELSLGITIEPEDVRMRYEIADMFTKFTGQQTNIVPNHKLVWTKVCYILGEMHPSNTVFDDKTELAIQKSFFDHMWQTSLNDLISQFPDIELPELDMSKTAKKLTTGKFDYSHEISSFQQTYRTEAIGVADITLGFGIEAMQDAARLAGIDEQELSKEPDEETKKQVRNLIALALDKNKAREELRTLHVLTCLHASFRWNRSQKFKANDLYDFKHAIAAIGYFDVFLTENPMKTLLEQKHHKISEDFNCKAISDLTEAVTHLESIVST